MTEQAREEGQRIPPFAGLRQRWRGVVAAGLIAAAGMTAAVALHRPASGDSRFAVVEQVDAPPTAARDPLMAELIRCRALPPQVDDLACRAAWEENRRRFFGETRATRVPGEPLPPSEPIPTSGSAPAATER